MEPWYRLAVIILKPLILLFFRREFHGADRIPKTGGCIVVANHISYADPFGIALYVHDTGRRPRFLAKAAIFRIPVAGRIVKGCRQIVVFRESADAAHALSAAVDAVNAGECVVIYPEGTVTKDPAYWPMLAKTGVARLALATGAPIIPVAQWGAQYFMGRDQRPHPWPRKLLQLRSGPPVDVSRWAGVDPTAETLREVTNHVMAAVADALAEIRGEPAPAEPFVPLRKSA